MREMLYRVACALTMMEYNAALQKLRCYKSELATWVEDNELEELTDFKFQTKRCGRMNNNVIERWNN